MNVSGRSWLRRRLRLTELGGVLLWPSLIGVLGALVTAGFRHAMRIVEYLLTGQTGGFVDAALALDPLTRLLVPTIGGCLAGLVLQYGMRFAPGRRTTDYMEAIALGDGFLSVRASLVKSASSLLSIGSGGSIGREGAMVQLSALVGSLFGRFLAFPTPSRRLLVSCGAAAGLASAYNAPLAAAVFVAEIVLQSLELESLGPVIVSAVVAGATLHELMGFAPVYEIPEFRLVSPVELLFYVLLGVAAGHLATFFLWMLERSKRFFRGLSLPLWMQLGCGGLVVGVLSVVNPRVWGNGYSVVNSILHQHWTWGALLFLLAWKMLATSAMAGSGAVGGVFTPSIFCGAALGALIGTGVYALIPGESGGPGAYAVVGMSAFLAGSTHAPLMSILMIFEMTRQYQILLPLMLASIVAHYVAKVYRKGRSIYAEALERKRGSTPPAQAGFRLRDLARRPEVVAAPDMSPERLRALFSETAYATLQVVDDAGRWCGVVSRPPRETAGDEEPFLTVGMSLEAVLEVAARTRGESLAVVQDAEGRQFVGTVARTDLLLAVDRALRHPAE